MPGTTIEIKRMNVERIKRNILFSSHRFTLNSKCCELIYLVWNKHRKLTIYRQIQIVFGLSISSISETIFAYPLLERNSVVGIYLNSSRGKGLLVQTFCFSENKKIRCPKHCPTIECKRFGNSCYPLFFHYPLISLGQLMLCGGLHAELRWYSFQILSRLFLIVSCSIKDRSGRV